MYFFVSLRNGVHVGRKAANGNKDKINKDKVNKDKITIKLICVNFTKIFYFIFNVSDFSHY